MTTDYIPSPVAVPAGAGVEVGAVVLGITSTDWQPATETRRYRRGIMVTGHQVQSTDLGCSRQWL